MTYPISSTDREEEIAGKSNAQNSQFMRRKEQINWWIPLRYDLPNFFDRQGERNCWLIIMFGGKV